jgi:tellurite resistance protein TerC
MEFLNVDWLGTPVWFWISFIVLVFGLTVFDLGVLQKRGKSVAKEMSIGQSIRLSAFYIAIALAFGLWIWSAKGADLALKYYTGFFIEKALSIDNIFVISMIFTFFAIPRAYQYRALVWGIIAVIVLRGLMIGLGAALVQEFYWVLYIFAAFLIATGVKMLVAQEKEANIADNPLVRFLSRHMRVTKGLHGEKFLVRERDETTGRTVLAATPLLLALIVINIADLVFAVDSVPAIFAITTDTFIVFTSNIMAILGLRALYFALAAMVHRFHYLKHALALVLIFIGSKIFVADFLLGAEKFPPLLSLGVTFALILGGVIVSLWKTRNSDRVKPVG